MTYRDKQKIASVNRLRKLGWTYARIAAKKGYRGRDNLYLWLSTRAVEIGGEWVPRDEVVRMDESSMSSQEHTTMLSGRGK